MAIADEIKIVYRWVFFIVVIGVLAIIISAVATGCRGESQKEGWITYKRSLDNTIRTGLDGYYPNGNMNGLPPSAPAFYLVPEYRLPYDWPRGFQTEYPIPHVEPLVSLN
jgi:hypothetical protein